MSLRSILASRSTKRDYAEAVRLWQDLQPGTSPETTDEQFRRVQAVWQDCTQDVVYYRNLVQGGQAPRELRSWDDFRQIPLIERTTLQEHQHELRRLSGPPDESRMTGGSTGTPVRVGVWREEAHPQRVAKLVLWHRCGYEPAKKLFLIWGHAHLLGSGLRGKWNHAMRKVKDGLLGYRRVDAYSLSPSLCDSFARQLIQFRPFGLIGYAAALDYFVRVTERYHEEFGRLGLGFVMPTSEMPPREDSFDLLGRVFRCPVIHEYGGVEFGQVAMKYAEEPFRVFPHLNYVEAVSDPGIATDASKVVLTSLTRRYIPLIRYAPGDGIADVTCLSNGHVDRFGRIKGRLHDVVQLPDGAVLHSMGVFHCIHQEKSVLNIQLVLADAGMKLRLVVTGQYDQAGEKRIRERLAQISSELGRMPFETVPDVQTTVAGKRRWIVDERSVSQPAKAAPGL